jgi:hypothetical protein
MQSIKIWNYVLLLIVVQILHILQHRVFDWLDFWDLSLFCFAANWGGSSGRGRCGGWFRGNCQLPKSDICVNANNSLDTIDCTITELKNKASA